MANKTKAFSDVVNYSVITQDVIISESPNSVTAILELYVSNIDKHDIMQSNHDRFIELLCDIPKDSDVSIYYIKRFKKEQIENIGNHENEVVNYIEKNNNEFITKDEIPVYQCFMSITFRVNTDNKNEFGLLGKIATRKEKSDKKEEINKHIAKTLRRLNLYIKSISASIDGTLLRLSSKQILQFLSLLINHNIKTDYNSISSIFKSDFICSTGSIFDPSSKGYVFYGENFHSVLSLRTNGKYGKLPEFTHASLNKIFDHKDLENIPFMIHQTINFVAKDKSISIAKRRKNMIATRGGLAKYMPWLTKTPEGIPPEQIKTLIEDSIIHIENTSHRFLNTSFNVIMWEKSLEKLDNNCDQFDATVRSTYRFFRDKLNTIPAFFSIFPGMEYINKINMMLPSYNIGDMLPIDMPRNCFVNAKSKKFIYYKNDHESLERIDLFDKRADNWNALIVGGSGSGKSFLANNILWQYMPYNPQIGIIDYGGADAGSYRSFVMNNRGTYLEVNFDSDLSINPFEGQLFDENGIPEASKFTGLITTIERMVSVSDSGELSGNTLFELQKALKEYYARHNNNADNSCDLNSFAEEMLKDNVDMIVTGRDLYKEIFMFIGSGKNQGPYAKFFRHTSSIKSKDIVCFDLEGLGGHQKLKNVLVPAILEMIVNNILGSSDKSRAKLIYMDEAWQDLKGGSGADFIENTARKARKLGGQITIITQSLSDIIDSPIAGAILTNTSYYYLVGNKHETEPLSTIKASSSQGSVTLSEYDVEMIQRSKSKRDFYLLTPFFSGMLRFYPSPEFIMLATTDPDDKIILRKHMQNFGENFITPAVIDSAKEEFFK